MVLTDRLINKFKSNINKNKIVITEEMLLEGIKLNSNVEKVLKDGLDKVVAGKRHIQLLTHVDLDGICSGIAIVQYLKKRGYSNDNITVTFGQYGDKKLRIKETPTKNKAVVVSDFAKISTLKIWDSFQLMSGFSFSAQKYNLVKYLNTTNFENYDVNDLVEDLKVKFSITPKSSKKTEADFKKSAKEILFALKAYSKIKDRKENPIEKITAKNIENYRLQDADPDYIVDHHHNEGALRGAKEGLIDVEVPSNAALLGKVLGVFSDADCDAINMIDAAQYDKNELKRATLFDDRFPTQSEERALAIKITAYIEQATKKDNRTAEAIIKNSAPTLKSLSETLEKALKLNAAKVKMLNALVYGKPVTDAKGKTKKIKDSKEVFAYIKQIINDEIPEEFKGDFDGHNSNKKTIDGIDRKVFNPESSFYKNREGKKLGEMANFEDVKKKALRTNDETRTGVRTKRDNAVFSELIKKNKGDLTDEQVETIVGGIKSDNKVSKENAMNLLMKIRTNCTDDEKKFIDKFISKNGRIGNDGKYFSMLKADEFSDVTKHYPGRYVSSLYSAKGRRFPFTIKKFGDFIQAAKNPLYKGDVDFAKVMPAVKKYVENYLENLYKEGKISKWVKDHVLESMNFNSGGHKAILSFQGFEELKAPSAVRNKKKWAEEMLSRIKTNNKLRNKREGTTGNNFPSLTAKSEGALKDANAKIGEINKYKQELMNGVAKIIRDETVRLFPPKTEDLKALEVTNDDDEMRDSSYD